MNYKFYFYPDPVDVTLTLTSDDDHVERHGSSYTDLPTGRIGQVIQVPDSIQNEHGASLFLEKQGYETKSFRGFLVLRTDGLARLQVDDFSLSKVVEVPPSPGPITPNPYADPFAIIQHVFDTTHPNLATEPGCGKFTEDCCKALHEQMHPLWGHIRKEPGQMQWNGHAIDAINLLVNSGQTISGIYDIIQSSLGPDARPAFNRVDDADNSKWYYPPSSVVGTVLKKDTRASSKSSHSKEK
jgi:hypothetical protein